MRKILIFTLLIVLVLPVLASCSSENSMSDLPTGNLLTSSNSPDGTYCFNAYLCADGGEMYVRGEVVVVATNETRNIYWAKYSDTLDIDWNSNTVVVLDEVSLDVLNDTYDCREK